MSTEQNRLNEQAACERKTQYACETENHVVASGELKFVRIMESTKISNLLCFKIVWFFFLIKDILFLFNEIALQVIQLYYHYEESKILLLW